jgi:Cellulase (glycosyl hydrolase family 5)/Chitobiase/beta-hexosaminidase C-terminal domain
MSLSIMGVSIMDLTKDLLDNPASQAVITGRINCLADAFPQLTHILLEIPMNTNAESVTVRGHPFAIDPAAYAAMFVTPIRARGLGVLWRGTDCYFEGLYGFPQQNGWTNAMWDTRATNWFNTNPTLLANGDIVVPFPEADTHQALNIGSTSNQFFITLASDLVTVGANNGKTITSGKFSRGFGQSLQHQYDSQFTSAGVASMDHYSNAIGLGKRLHSWPYDQNVINNMNTAIASGTATYTVPSSITENSLNQCDFIPDKTATNDSIDVYIVNKGTGDWTMTIHDGSNNPVTLPDHTNISSLTNSYQVTIPNAQLQNNAYNTFSIPWCNLNPDVTYHFHLTSTVADGTVRVISGQQGNLNQVCAQQYKGQATPESFEIDFRNLYSKVGVPIFIEEIGDFWSLDPTRSSPIRTQAQHTAYLASLYAMFQRLVNDGVVMGLCYWRATDTLQYNNYATLNVAKEGIIYNTGNNVYALNYAGQQLQTFFANNAAAPTAPAAPSTLVATAISTTEIDLSWQDNSSNELGFLIERKTGAGAFAQIASVGIGMTIYKDTSLTAGTQYSYQVRAYNAVGDSAYTNTATASTNNNPAPLPVVATPMITPGGGIFINSVSVLLSTTQTGGKGNFSYYGLALSGLEFGSAVPGTQGQDYFQPTAQNFVDIKGVKENLVRLPFQWERMQPTLNGPLDPVYKSYIDTAIANAAANGVSVILDAHNFGRRYVLWAGGFTTSTAMWTGGRLVGSILSVSNFNSVAAGSVTNPVSPAISYIWTSSLTVNSQNGQLWNAAWLQFFKTDANNFLFFTFHPTNNFWEFVKRVNGNDTIIATGPLTVTLGVPLTCVIDVGQSSAGNVSLTVNSTLITTQAIPSGFTNGQIGLFVNGVSASLDLSANILNINGDTSSGTSNTGTFAIDDGGPLTHTHFANFWSAMSTAYKNNATVLAYDIMNEWHDMTVPLTSSTYNSTATSTVANQAATDTIRATGDTKYIIWEWDSYSNLHRGPGVTLANAGLFGPNPTKWWTDSLNKVVLSGHYYFDGDHSGSYTLPFTNTDLTRINGEMSPTLTWCQNNNVPFLLGETGVPPNDTNYVNCMSAALSLLASFPNVWVSFWAMGNFYSSATAIVPTANTLFNTLALSYAQNAVNIYYTLDGSIPTPNSNLFTSGAITLNANTQLRAYATSKGLTDSAIANASFTITQSSSPTTKRFKKRQNKLLLASII